MNSTQYTVLKSIETKKRKTYQLSYKGDDQDKIFNLNTNMPKATYINAFNLYLNRLRDLEYKTKNPELFTWRQNTKYLNRLKIPIPFLNEEEEWKRPRKELAERKMIKTTSEYSLGVHRVISSDNAFTPRKSFVQSVNKVRAIIKPFGSGTKEEQRDENPLRKREKRTGSEPVITEPIDLSKFDLSSPQRTKRAFSISKLQTSLLLPRSSSVPEIQNFQYMQDQFNRKNTQINKILSQVNPREDLLDKEKIQQETIKKIQMTTKDYKLHQFLKPRDKANRSVSPQLRAVNITKERPNSASRAGHAVPGLSKTVLPKTLPVLKIQDINSLVIQKHTSKDKPEEKDYPNSALTEKEKHLQSSIRNLMDGERSSKKRKGFLQTTDKTKPKSLVKRLDFALHKMNEQMNISDQMHEDVSPTSPTKHNSIFLNPRHNTERTHKHADSRKSKEPSFDPEIARNSSNNTPKHGGNKSIANSPESPTHFAAERDNILNYKIYFKQKYQEKGTNLEFSNQLNKKLHDVNKEVQTAIKNAQEL